MTPRIWAPVCCSVPGSGVDVGGPVPLPRGGGHLPAQEHPTRGRPGWPCGRPRLLVHLVCVPVPPAVLQLRPGAGLRSRHDPGHLNVHGGTVLQEASGNGRGRPGRWKRPGRRCGPRLRSRMHPVGACSFLNDIPPSAPLPSLLFFISR